MADIYIDNGKGDIWHTNTIPIGKTDDVIRAFLKFNETADTKTPTRLNLETVDKKPIVFNKRPKGKDK